MGNDSFGLKIGIEGEKEFKKILSEINQSVKVLGSEMQLVTNQFDKNDKSAAALAARNTVLSKEIDTQKEKVNTLRTALDNAATSFGENDKRTQNWQIQLNKAEAELAGIILNILSGSLTIDSELKTCFFGNVAQNQNMNGDFPVFNVGNNTITLGTGITRIEIEPRWRYI